MNRLCIQGCGLDAIIIMVDTSDAILVENTPVVSSVSTYLKRADRDSVIVEEFPRVETEIVRLEDGKTARVSGAGIKECAFYSRQVQRRSGRFSLFNWFKRHPSVNKNREDREVPSNKIPDDEEKTRNIIYSSNASVDTTGSTATVHSFTFRPGRRFKLFRKHASADNFVETHPSRLSSRVSLQFDSDPSINVDDRSGDLIFRPASISAAEINLRQKDKADKDRSKLYDNYRSLPTHGKTADLDAGGKKLLAHVRGKRKAPKPPCQLDDKILTKEEKTRSVSRRKRQAPKPPVLYQEVTPNSEVKTKKCTENCSATLITDSPVTVDTFSMLKRECENLKKEGKEERADSAISNDTLKLEGGVLLGKKSPDVMNHVIIKQESSEGVKKPVLSTGSNSSHVAPRPWYKRSNTTLSERDICSSFKREVLKIPTLTKLSRDKGFGRFSHHEINPSCANRPHSDMSSPEISTSDKSFSRLNHFFGRNEHTCKTKKDEKRKSNLSILTNISELDREAAAIVQEEQARNQAIISRSFPTSSNDLGRSSSGEIISEMVSSSIEPQRRGTRALISKFNAISNITRVTVNATFFAKSSGDQSTAKIDVVRGDQRVKTSNRNDRDRIVTKRLLYDGAEQVNETGDISSINFFRHLEAEASKTPQNDAMPDLGWEEKIKRYFPDRAMPGNNEERARELGRKELDINQRQSRNFQNDFEFVDNRNRRLSREPINVDKIEHLSRADLKEMLIEMKHSLPKRPKPKLSTAEKSKPVVAGNHRVLNVAQNPKADNNPSATDNEPKATTSSANGRLIKPETTRRRIKSRGEEIVLLVDKTKVSSAAQTSANLRKIETPAVLSREKKLQLAAIDKPISKPEWKFEDDTIYTTKGNNPNRSALSRNTFQLIRPRDFACIEALKTEKGAAGASKEAQNTYMNVIEDSLYANAVIHPAELKIDTKIKDEDKNGDKINEKDADLGIAKPEIVRNYTASVLADVKVREDQSRKPETRKEVEGEEKTGSIETNMNTLAINRLLRKLEGAIASGQHQQAAGLAKELAQLKIHCSVVRQRSADDNTTDFINVDMYIEDKLAHQGPIPLQLSLNMTVAELKKKIFAEFEIPANVQRWIIGKNLADNDDFTLDELKAVDKSSIFLYLVAPDLQNDECTRADVKPVVKEEEAIETPVDEEPPEILPIVDKEVENIPEQEPTLEELKLKRYEHLMSLENSDVIPNSVPIECPICFAPYGPCEGVILRDCLHMFCRTCIANTIMYCEEAEVKCPFRDSEYTCESTLQEREIKALVTPEIYEQHLAKSVSQAENNAGNNAFHCKTPDCRGWCIYDDNVNVFVCPVCGVNNCLTCQAIHANKNCREYQDEIRLLKETDQETKRTAAVLEEMVESGEALACPTCAVVLMKKWGCDWLRCSMCKTEICWVTRGPRWGPAGKGDTSGGCKCGENGVKCHPRCNYCH